MSQMILDRWYAALKAGDAGALAAVTTDDVIVRWNGPVGLVPWAGVWEGRAKVITFFKRVAEHLEIVSIETVQTIAGEGGVAIVLSGHWRVRASGEDLRVRAANIFRFEDGKVAAFEVYPDSHAFAEALARA
ncbi:nuclear transport factor 2 family protein [Phreatobacter aquaticus]|uniref:Nuclear transport factor 2 family protein n=1 Tax=Phreatobacter aquaticus TaxID=2570229 RepID=A0A4D7QG98_9HYPH|nr:nuclear transport factor 2 family protein [Phreatobacter aquaticus]QCK84663.1 nuclear transport factor 2 family protein [Phreatobacter aquaticus]